MGKLSEDTSTFKSESSDSERFENDCLKSIDARLNCVPKIVWLGPIQSGLFDTNPVFGSVSLFFLCAPTTFVKKLNRLNRMQKQSFQEPVSFVHLQKTENLDG